MGGGGWKWVPDAQSSHDGKWTRKADKVNPKTGLSKSAYVPCQVCDGWKWAHRVNKTHCDRCGTKYGECQSPKSSPARRDSPAADSKDKEKDKQDESEDPDDKDAEQPKRTTGIVDINDPGCVALVALLNLVGKDATMSSIPGVTEALARLNQAAAEVGSSGTAQAEQTPVVTLEEAKKKSAEASKVWKQITNQMNQKTAKVDELKDKLNKATKELNAVKEKYAPAAKENTKWLNILTKLTKKSNDIDTPKKEDDDSVMEVSSESSFDVSKCDLSKPTEDCEYTMRMRQKAHDKAQASMRGMVKLRVDAMEKVNNKRVFVNTIEHVKDTFIKAKKVVHHQVDQAADTPMSGAGASGNFASPLGLSQDIPEQALTPGRSPVPELELIMRTDEELLAPPRQPAAAPSLPDLPTPIPQAPLPDEIAAALASPPVAPLAVPVGITTQDVQTISEMVKGESKGKGKGSVRFSEYDDNEAKKLTEASEAAEAAANAGDFAGNPDVPLESNPEDATLDENGYMKR